MTHSTERRLAFLRHELRTPINAIIGYSEMLLEDGAAEDHALMSELQQIQVCGTRLLEEINTLFALDDPLDSNPLAEETIRAELQPPLDVVIERCRQLVEKATAEILPDIEKISAAAQTLLTRINGIADLSEPLPLAASKEILEANRAVAPTTITRPDADEDRASTHPSTILVVDDNETNRDLLSRLIQGEGYAVETAGDGQQALQMIQTGEYDLILLDIMMPQMNGYEVLAWLRSSQWRHIPAIAISALDEINSVVKCIEMGAADYLPKPFNAVLLRARIGACLEKKQLRDQEVQYLAQLTQANQEIASLNKLLKAENLRLNAELDVTRRLQQMILPKEKELSQIEALEISGFMEPAAEFGGDYFDVLEQNGCLKIGIGDVTGHGLESCLLMIMVQTAVRTLMENNESNPQTFLEVLNRTIYKNVQRISSDKNLTLSLVDYRDGYINLSGQHEEMIVVRSGGTVEKIDTFNLGFPLGLEESIGDFIAQSQTQLHSGDIVVLYTDGVTEAENEAGELYGLERLCEVVKKSWRSSAKEIREIAIDDLRQHIGKQKVYDDITLLILKQK